MQVNCHAQHSELLECSCEQEHLICSLSNANSELWKITSENSEKAWHLNNKER